MAKTKKLNKYPSPREDKEFTRYWDRLINLVSNRTNFKEGHLVSLEILCTMLVEKDELTDMIALNGSTYETEGRFGLQVKTRPEVQQRNIIRAEIARYLKLLGIMLEKDLGAKENEDTAWE